MPFKYVLIPADVNCLMQELEFEDVVSLENDNFRKHIEEYFRSLGDSVDRSLLLQQLKERTGMDVEEKAKDMPDGALDRLLSSSSVEIFPVMLPTKGTDFKAVSAYCDDKGVAKNLPKNDRASGLVQACGYPGQTFQGDIFLGSVFDDNEDEWYRTSMTLKECNTDSAWIAACKNQRSNRSSGDMAALANKIGAKNPAHINSAMDVDEGAKGETEEYKWKQAGEEVEITFKKDGLQKSDVKLVKVAFSRQRLRVEVKGEVMLDSALYGMVTPDECSWTVSDGVLQVNLTKASEDSWSELLKAA